MSTYTADAVALLVYLVDALPGRADIVFAEAEAGETVIQAPSTALAEVLYSVSRDKNVRGVVLTGTPEDARQALVGNEPVSVAPVDDAELVEYAQVVDEFSIHDGLMVPSGTPATTPSGSDQPPLHRGAVARSSSRPWWSVVWLAVSDHQRLRASPARERPHAGTASASRVRTRQGFGTLFGT